VLSLASVYKCYSRGTSPLWPIAARDLCYGEQRFPNIGVTIRYAVGHLRPAIHDIA
jgi:hypothetical protein